MGLIDTIKPLSTFFKTGTIYKSQQHQNIFLRMLRIEPGTAVLEARLLSQCHAAPPPLWLILWWNGCLGTFFVFRSNQFSLFLWVTNMKVLKKPWWEIKKRSFLISCLATFSLSLNLPPLSLSSSLSSYFIPPIGRVFIKFKLLTSALTPLLCSECWIRTRVAKMGADQAHHTTPPLNTKTWTVSLMFAS